MRLKLADHNGQWQVLLNKHKWEYLLRANISWHSGEYSLIILVTIRGIRGCEFALGISKLAFHLQTILFLNNITTSLLISTSGSSHDLLQIGHTTVSHNILTLQLLLTTILSFVKLTLLHKLIAFKEASRPNTLPSPPPFNFPSSTKFFLLKQWLSITIIYGRLCLSISLTSYFTNSIISKRISDKKIIIKINKTK